MHRSVKAALPLFLSLLVSPACADIYSWTDGQGTVHFAEDPGQVPKPFRNKMVKREEEIASPAEEPAPAPEAKGKDQDASQADTTGTFGGRSYSDWTKGLAERELAMNGSRAQAEAIVETLRSALLQRQEREKLMAEHRQLKEQFTKQKAEYYQWVESARKAGLTVNIQE